MGLEQLTEEFVLQINNLHEIVSAQNWREMTRDIFVETLGKSVTKLEKLRDQSDKIRQELLHAQNPIELNELVREFDKLMPFLERNLELEQKRSPSEKVNLKDVAEMPELYSSIEQKILTLLLRCRYFAERLVIFVRKNSSTPIEGKSAARDILQLLEKKESELQQLKKKYENMRKKSYLGTLEEETSSDLEQSLITTNQNMEKTSTELSAEMKDHKKSIELLQQSLTAIDKKIAEQREAFDNFGAKSFELITVLKKERDYAKKIVLDVEHETLQLRNAYSREIINMQSEKNKARDEAEEKYERRMILLRKEIKKSDDLLHHFRIVAESKAKKLEETKEKLAETRAMLHTKKKHEAVKNKFKKENKKTDKTEKKKKSKKRKKRNKQQTQIKK